MSVCDDLWMLAQENAIFNLRNGILLVLLIGILVAYKIYKSRQT